MDTRRIVIIGGGAAGLSAAYTLRNRGFAPVLLEANNHAGGRLAGEKVEGFSVDSGANFFCSSYDVAFRICEELGVSLIRSKMNLGWYRNGRWALTVAGPSTGQLIKMMPSLHNLGFLTPGGIWTSMKLANRIFRQSEFLNFASDSRLSELDGEETFGEYMDKIGMSESMKVSLRGFLEMTMGCVERSGEAYMRTYLSETLLKAHKIYVPEKGTGALADALANECEDAIRLSTPAKRVVVRDGLATGVVVDSEIIEADAVICATTPAKASDIIPDLPSEIRQTLSGIAYSTGCRVVIGLDRPPLPPGWHGALYPQDDTPLLLDRSINLPACVPAGKSSLDIIVGRDRAKELIHLDDDEIKRRTLGQARKNPPPGSDLPADDEGIFTRVYRWDEAVCMGRPGMFSAVARVRSQLRWEIPNLFLAGDYTRAPSVNGALASGVGAAEEVAEFLTLRPE